MRRKTTRRSAATQRSAVSTVHLCIGDCNVNIPHSLVYNHCGDSVSIKVPNHDQISITRSTTSAESREAPDCDGACKAVIFKQGCQDHQTFLEGVSVQLLNPKSLDNEGHFLLKAVLNLYSTELPEMSFAANTGKESRFLDKCVSSGKYCTLLLRRVMHMKDEVLAAVSYQILPPDTQYAEIPVAAVSKDHQRKGLGSFLFTELQRRLQDVGVLTIFCWGDQESEKFWVKKGFVKVAEVDFLGKPRKLPIKPEVRRAMSIPGNATLLVSHIYKKAPILVPQIVNNDATTPPKLAQSDAVQGINESAPTLCLQPSPASFITTPVVGEFRAPLKPTELPVLGSQFVKSSTIMPMNMDSAFSSVATQRELRRPMTPNKDSACMGTLMEPMLSLTFAPPSQGVTVAAGDKHDSADLVMPNQEGKMGANSQASFELNEENIHVRSYQRGQKRQKSASLQVGMLKKQKTEDESFQICKGQDCESMIPQSHRTMVTDLPDMHSAAEPPRNVQEEDKNKNLSCLPNFGQQSCPTIMFMNMADANRRMQLTNFVERLGGRVTNDGSQCTHVVTGEARRTLNFCNALNAGAWVVSPAWLKASAKEKRFVDERAFILKDAAFESKYKTTLDEVIRRRKQMPHGLLQGMCIYPTRHVQPPVETVSSIVLSAGGKVLASFEEAKCCLDAIVVACEDDISEALMAAKEGLATYSSEWLMGCIMKQELDMTAAQFAESL